MPRNDTTSCEVFYSTNVKGRPMSRGTISTGGIDFNLSDQVSETLTRNSQTPMHVAILGDFSGRKAVQRNS